METSPESSTSSNQPASKNSPSRSNAKPADQRLSPIAVSISLHASVAGVVALVMALANSGTTVETVEVKVIENPAPAAANLDLSKPPPPEPPPPPKEPARKVFGATRKSVTTEGETGVDVKQGNTVATEPDNEKLKDSDADSLPIPTDEYLVSRMPSIKTRVKIPYPPEAKEQKVAGLVVMELLIDATGRVREAKLLRGPGFGLNEAALAAIKQFIFSPAEVNGKPVAVRTQFTYEFILEE